MVLWLANCLLHWRASHAVSVALPHLAHWQNSSPQFKHLRHSDGWRFQVSGESHTRMHCCPIEEDFVNLQFRHRIWNISHMYHLYVTGCFDLLLLLNRLNPISPLPEATGGVSGPSANCPCGWSGTSHVYLRAYYCAICRSVPVEDAILWPHWGHIHTGCHETHPSCLSSCFRGKPKTISDWGSGVPAERYRQSVWKEGSG